MTREELTTIITSIIPGATFPQNKQYLEVLVSSEFYHELAFQLKTRKDTAFDYLISQSGVDYGKELCVVNHLTSTTFLHTIILKVKTGNRENPAFDTVSDIWKTAEFQEREIFDLYGIHFNNHPDMRRIFLADDWNGFPLRKDYKDEVNIIER